MTDSREDMFDSSLNTVDFSYGPKEEEFYFLHFYGEMSDDNFHRMMSVDDLTYSIAFSDEVFDNGEWHIYAGLETCNSGIDNLTYLSGDDTKSGTDHTKADVYESSNNMSVGNSISENQVVPDSDLEDDLFFFS